MFDRRTLIGKLGQNNADWQYCDVCSIWFFLPLITELKSRKRIVLAAIIVPICFEVAQLFFGRSFDVDDLICNFIGIIIGAMVAYLILKTNSTDVPKGR